MKSDEEARATLAPGVEGQETVLRVVPADRKHAFQLLGRVERRLMRETKWQNPVVCQKVHQLHFAHFIQQAKEGNRLELVHGAGLQHVMIPDAELLYEGTARAMITCLGRTLTAPEKERRGLRKDVMR